jgi:queuine tRNA-ribosyltransferase
MLIHHAVYFLMPSQEPLVKTTLFFLLRNIKYIMIIKTYLIFFMQDKEFFLHKTPNISPDATLDLLTNICSYLDADTTIENTAEVNLAAESTLNSNSTVDSYLDSNSTVDSYLGSNSDSVSDVCADIPSDILLESTPGILGSEKQANYPQFSVHFTSTQHKGRLGVIYTAHGSFETPAFYCCATKASLKGLSLQDIDRAQTPILLANTYHLLLSPGPDLIAQQGGLHAWMNWKKPLFTDSGGFQIFSLGHGSVADEIKGRSGKKPIDPKKNAPQTQPPEQKFLKAQGIRAHHNPYSFDATYQRLQDHFLLSDNNTQENQPPEQKFLNAQGIRTHHNPYSFDATHQRLQDHFLLSDNNTQENQSAINPQMKHTKPEYIRSDLFLKQNATFENNLCQNSSRDNKIFKNSSFKNSFTENSSVYYRSCAVENSIDAPHQKPYNIPYQCKENTQLEAYEKEKHCNEENNQHEDQKNRNANKGHNKKDDSLTAFDKNQKNNNKKGNLLLSVKEIGARFRSYINGQEYLLTPEESMRTQIALGADFITVLDICTPFHSSYEETKAAMERSHRWGSRSLDYVKKHGQAYQGLYGIIQGGIYPDLRNESINFVRNNPFFAYAIGGTLGDTKDSMYKIVTYVMNQIVHDKKPVHLLGIGGVQDIFHGVSCGIDTFDCVYPTRLARHGGVLMPWPKLNDADQKRGYFNITQKQFSQDKRPLDDECCCETCQTYSRSYLHFLFKNSELLGQSALSRHNVFFMNRLMSAIRTALKNDLLWEEKDKWCLC